MRKSVQFLLLFLMCISASWTWASDAPERTVLFNMGDYDSQYWRIPALVTAADNSLVAVVDKRGSSLGDLPNTISIMSMYFAISLFRCKVDFHPASMLIKNLGNSI